MLEFAPSGSSGVDALLACARTLAEDASLKEGLQFDKHVETLQAFRRKLESDFRRSLRLVPSPSYQVHLPAFDKAFERFRAGGRRLESYLKSGSVEDLEVGCQRVHAAVTELQELARPLRELEEAWKSQASEGLLGEVEFLAQRVTQGEWAPQAAAQVIEQQLEICRQASRHLKAARSSWSGDIAERALSALKEAERAFERVRESLNGRAVTETDARFAALLEALRPLPEFLAKLEQEAPVSPEEEPPRPRFRAFAEIEESILQWMRLGASLEPAMSRVHKFAQDLKNGRVHLEADQDLTAQEVAAMLAALDFSLGSLEQLEKALQAPQAERVEAALQRLLEAESEMILARPQSTPNS